MFLKGNATFLHRDDMLKSYIGMGSCFHFLWAFIRNKNVVGFFVSEGGYYSRAVSISSMTECITDDDKDLHIQKVERLSER